MPRFDYAKYSFHDGASDEHVIQIMFDDLRYDHPDCHVLLGFYDARVLRSDGLQFGHVEVKHKGFLRNTQGLNWYIFKQATIIYTSSKDSSEFRASNHKGYGDYLSFFPLPGKPSAYPQYPGLYLELDYENAIQTVLDDASYDNPGSHVVVCHDEDKLRTIEGRYVETAPKTHIESKRPFGTMGYGVWIFKEAMFVYTGSTSSDSIRYTDDGSGKVYCDGGDSCVYYTFTRVDGNPSTMKVYFPPRYWKAAKNNWDLGPVVRDLKIDYPGKNILVCTMDPERTAEYINDNKLIILKDHLELEQTIGTKGFEVYVVEKGCLIKMRPSSFDYARKIEGPHTLDEETRIVEFI